MRHGITSSALCGESADVDTAIVTDWKERVPSLHKNYAPVDVFNVDEWLILESNVRQITGCSWRRLQRWQEVQGEVYCHIQVIWKANNKPG